MNNKLKAINYVCSLAILFLGLFVALPPSHAERPRPRNLVIIDPAHGGGDEGGRVSGSEREKDVTLKIALALEKELRRGNIPVLLTRTADRDVSLTERQKTASAPGAVLLISIHVNSGFGRQATGYEVYFPGFTELPAGKDGAAAIIKDMVGNKHLNESVALAQYILRDLQEVFPRKDRGLRSAPLPLFDGLVLPAVAVEVGFATNLEDREKISDEQGRQAVAHALSKSISEFMRLKAIN